MHYERDPWLDSHSLEDVLRRWESMVGPHLELPQDLVKWKLDISTKEMGILLLAFAMIYKMIPDMDLDIRDKAVEGLNNLTDSISAGMLQTSMEVLSRSPLAGLIGSDDELKVMTEKLRAKMERRTDIKEDDGKSWLS